VDPPAIELDKRVEDKLDYYEEDQPVPYVLMITSNKNEPLKNIIITDDQLAEYYVVGSLKVSRAPGGDSDAAIPLAPTEYTFNQLEGKIETGVAFRLPAGDALIVEYELSFPDADTYINRAEARATGADSDIPTGPDEDEETVIVEPPPTVGIDKIVDIAPHPDIAGAYGPVAAGTQAEYTVTVTNNNEKTKLKDIVITDDWLKVCEDDPVVEYRLAAGSVRAMTSAEYEFIKVDGKISTKTGFVLNQGDQIIITYSLDLSEVGENINIARVVEAKDTVTGKPADPAEDTVVVVVDPPEAELVKSVEDALPYYEGEPVPYVVTFTNSGGEPLKNIEITDDLLAEYYVDGTLKVSRVPVGGGAAVPLVEDADYIFDQSEGTIETTKEIFTLPAGDALTIEYDLLFPDADTYINKAEATAKGVYSDEPTDPEDEETVIVGPPPAVGIDKTVDIAPHPDITGVHGPVPAGTQAEYTVTVTNNNENASLKDIVITDDWLKVCEGDPFVQYNPVVGPARVMTGAEYAFTRADGAISTKTGFILNQGDQIIVTYSLDLTEVGNNTNIARVEAKDAATGKPVDPDEDTVTVVVDPPEVEIDKTAPDFAYAGERVPYVVTVSNIGKEPLKNIIVTDTLLAEYFVVGTLKVSRAPGGDPNAAMALAFTDYTFNRQQGTIETADAFRLPVGDALIIEYRLLFPDADIYVNRANVTADGVYSGEPADPDEDEETVEIEPRPTPTPRPTSAPTPTPEPTSTPAPTNEPTPVPTESVAPTPTPVASTPTPTASTAPTPTQEPEPTTTEPAPTDPATSTSIPTPTPQPYYPPSDDPPAVPTNPGGGSTTPTTPTTPNTPQDPTTPYTPPSDPPTTTPPYTPAEPIDDSQVPQGWVRVQKTDPVTGETYWILEPEDVPEGPAVPKTDNFLNLPPGALSLLAAILLPGAVGAAAARYRKRYLGKHLNKLKHAKQ
jgi:uncharacterized repeat protein (TIGR01451 family)